MASGNIQYAFFLYWDDDDILWSVELRKRNGQIGNFTPLTWDEFQDHPRAGFIWPYQRLAMRHITVKTDDGKILKFPCQRRTSANYNNIGGIISIPIWDTGIDDGGAPSPTVNGRIISRTGERPKPGAFIQLPGSTPA